MRLSKEGRKAILKALLNNSLRPRKRNQAPRLLCHLAALLASLGWKRFDKFTFAKNPLEDLLASLPPLGRLQLICLAVVDGVPPLAKLHTGTP